MHARLRNASDWRTARKTKHRAGISYTFCRVGALRLEDRRHIIKPRFPSGLPVLFISYCTHLSGICLVRAYTWKVDIQGYDMIRAWIACTGHTDSIYMHMVVDTSYPTRALRKRDQTHRTIWSSVCLLLLSPSAKRAATTRPEISPLLNSSRFN